MLQGQEMKRMSPWGASFGSGRSSDSAAMASGPPDVMANQEPAEVGEECSGKKKSKFQTFKKFFARKKRKEPSSSGADAGLKASQSSDNVSKTSENNTLTRSEKDKGSDSKISLGNKALSHDSVFVSDSSEANEALGASQDSIHGKVKSLQLQLKQAIRLGSPPSLMCVKRTEDAGTMSEDDGLPCSPPEYTTPHTVLNQAQRNSSISVEGTDSDEDQLSCAASSRAVSPLVVVPGDFSQPASPFGCLDNSAAKHKMGLRHKACNRRKPANRLEIKAEGDSVVKEILNTSLPDSLEEREEQKTRDASGDELKLKVEREDEEEEEEEQEEEKEQLQHSRESLLSDKQEREEGEDESEAEQDVSQGPDASSPPEPCLSEEEAVDAQPSSKLSSRSSSLDSPRATPEPPAGQREYLLDPPSIAYETEENRDEGSQTLGRREEEVRETGEEESSFLQEVLSSLKTPLASCSLGVETEAVLEIEEDKMKEEVEVEEGEEVEEEATEEEEHDSYQAAPSGLLLLGQSTEEEEEAATPSCQDDEEENKDEEEMEAEEEELEVERFSQHSQQQQEEEGEKEEAEEVKPEEENNLIQRNTDQQVEEEEEEEEQSEGEEEAIELEKEPEVEEEGREKREEDDEEVEVKKGKERVEEAEEAEEEEEKDDAEEMTEMFPDAAGGEVHRAAPSQEEVEGVDVAVGDDTVHVVQHTGGDEIPAELGDQESATELSNQNSEDEKNDGEERAEEGVEIEHTEQKSDQEEDKEVNQADVDETEPDLEQESVEVLDLKHVEKDQTEVNQSAAEQVSSKPSSLSLQESHFETQPEDSKTSSTTTIHINLVSPSSEKVAFSFQQSPTSADPKVTESPSHTGAATEKLTASTDEESADKVKEEEEEEEKGKQSSEEDAMPPVSVEETVNQSSSGSDQSKVRFTINPSWQRSLSIGDAKDNVTPPSSPPACISSSSSSSATIAGPGGVDVAATAKKDPQVEAEPASSAKVELVLSPGRARNAGSTAAKPQSNASQAPIKPPASEESSVVVEGNPDNPFGVRLRKTVALHRFSSEEENTEPPTEPPAQPTSCKVESPQPISVKPSISQPISNKPALPKKPEVHGDSGVKTKRISDAAAVRAVSGGSDSPSWISVAKQKQKIYKESSLDEITVKKEEQERKSSLPMYVCSAASKEQSNKTPESTSKVSPLEFSKSSVFAEKESRRALSPPTPVPAQPPKSQSLPCPVAPKPQLPPATAKHPPQPTPAQRSLSPPTPVPVPQKPPSCTSPTSLPKTATSSKTQQAQSTTLTSPPFSSRTTPPQSGSRAAALSGQTPSTQRGLPTPDSPQDEPPWMALAKKKAKAWSEMPQIVQ